jgi:hypothetical protein
LSQPNNYYCPEAFKIINDKVHLLPLWTGCILKICQTDFHENKLIDRNSLFFHYSRLSNNNAEGYFSHLKTNLLQLEKKKLKNKLTLSQLAIPIFEDLQSKYIEFGYVNYSENNYNIKNVKESIEEIWKDKKRVIDRQKGFYYNNNLKLSKFNNISTQTGIICSVYFSYYYQFCLFYENNFPKEETDSDDIMDCNEKIEMIYELEKGSFTYSKCTSTVT